MIEEYYKSRYISRVKASNNYKDMKIIIGLMKELASYGKDAIPVMQQVEQDMLDRGLIAFKVSSGDLDKLGALDTSGKIAQMYLCEAFRWWIEKGEKPLFDV